MTQTLQYPSRCGECGLRMSVGDEFISTATTSGKWIISHVECPPKNERQQNVARPGFDPEDLYVMRKCDGECRNLWSYRKGARLDVRCPSCDGAWVRGDENLVAWAA